MSTYTKIDASQVPGSFRFDVSRHADGQIVEVAYGGPMAHRGEHDGTAWKRVTDRSEPLGSPARVTYYRRR